LSFNDAKKGVEKAQLLVFVEFAHHLKPMVV